MSTPLPIESVLPELRARLDASRNVVLCAPPGAGKTTHVPLALLDAPWMQDRRLIMLEPRRLATRRAAEYMASQIGQRTGATVGYRTRGDSHTSDTTRVEVVTEGILTRLLHQQPDLPGVSLLIFDEFHERSIHADLGLALALDVQEHLRIDLRILVMSATLDGLAVSRLLGNAPVVESKGRTYPVDTHYLAYDHNGAIEPKVVEVVQRALQDEQGDVLVFLPGQREIRRVETMLADAQLTGVVVRVLYGEASDAAQRAALAPAPAGTRKVILSTSIAETSLTIDGVRIVVDAGLARVPRFDPRRGMAGLITVPVSQATAEQRRGRAGRQQPGVCYRLWTEACHRHLPTYPTPEILATDLAPFALDLARWGVRDTGGLRFLDPPPHSHLAQAVGLLQRLGAIDASGRLTPHGKAMSDLPVHPRLAHMLLRGRELGLGALACDLAALLEDRDLLRGQERSDVDLTLRWQALRSGERVDRGIHLRVTAEAGRLKGLLGITNDPAGSPESIGVLVALAYPERIGKRRSEQQRRYLTSGGTGAVLPEWSLLTRHEYLAIADVDGEGTDARVFLAAPVEKEQLIEVFGDAIEAKDEIYWDAIKQAVTARRIQALGTLVLSESANDDTESVKDAMADGVRQMGLSCLPWTKASAAIRARSEWLRLSHYVSPDWPNLSDTALLASLRSWLLPFLAGMTRQAHLGRLDMQKILLAQFTPEQRRSLDTLAPTSIKVPTGSHIRLEYAADAPPVLAVKLQEMFGQTETPTVANGNARVMVHLLSPAGRPLAVTQDLRSFWANVYPDVRKEMRGRYPKHPWPDDPLHATPSRRLQARSGTKRG